MNLLIPYRYFYDHSDPLFNEFTYGDVGTRARKLKSDLKKGDYVFFHTGINGNKYITAYYVVDRVLDSIAAIKDRNISAKYKNPHISDVASGKAISTDDDVLLFGDPIASRVLEKPLLFDIDLAKRLSLGISFPKGRTDAQSVGSATRAWRKLEDSDVCVLLTAIDSSEKDLKRFQSVLSTNEVTEVIEKDIEGFIEKNPTLLGDSLVLKNRHTGDILVLLLDKTNIP